MCSIGAVQQTNNYPLFENTQLASLYDENNELLPVSLAKKMLAHWLHRKWPFNEQNTKLLKNTVGVNAFVCISWWAVWQGEMEKSIHMLWNRWSLSIKNIVVAASVTRPWLLMFSLKCQLNSNKLELPLSVVLPVSKLRKIIWNSVSLSCPPLTEFQKYFLRPLRSVVWLALMTSGYSVKKLEITLNNFLFVYCFNVLWL